MNTFWKNFRVTTFWESHWEALWAVIDWCPAWLKLDVKDIQIELDKRKPWTSKITSQRKEWDKAQILSWVFEWNTIWTPIAVIVKNENQISKDYSNIKDLYRPWHADQAWQEKFWIRDYRGWWRSSWRETIWRVIGWAIAKKLISLSWVEIIAHTICIWEIESNTFNKKEIEKNNVKCADSKIAKDMEKLILKTKQEWNSLGWKVRLQITSCPKWIWEPVFWKLQALIAQALFSIWSVRSVELLPWKQSSRLKWSESNQISSWISWWISTWEEIIFDITIKATPSISLPQVMKDKKWKIHKDITITWRHDPCIVPRIIPVIENMWAMVIADLLLEKKLNKKN